MSVMNVKFKKPLTDQQKKDWRRIVRNNAIYMQGTKAQFTVTFAED